MKPFKIVADYGIVLTVIIQLNINCLRANPLKSENGDIYDFIIVGGGTAGCVVAGRLAEQGIYNVLLIEAGEFPEPEFSVPALSYEKRKEGLSKTIHMYQTVPQRKSALGLNGTINFMVGRALGGSSVINGMQLSRGSPHDYSKWARDTFDNDWGYSNMLQYFKKFENYTGPFPTDQRGYDGSVTVSSQYAPGRRTWLQSGVELGYPIGDSNGPQKISFTPVDSTQNNGRRVTSFEAYIQTLPESIRGENLHILMNTEATKIIFEGKRAVAVEYKTSLGDQTTRGWARARKEIIISAGFIGSPYLMLKSGIGPRPHMDATKIPIVRYLTGVGNNLQEHPVVHIPVILNKTAEFFDPQRDLTPETWETYTRYGTGPYTSFMGIAGQAYLSSKSSSSWKSPSSGSWADILLYFFNSPSAPFPSQYREEIDRDVKETEVYAIITTNVGRPQSRGTIKLNTENIEGPPLIDFRMLTHPSDMHVALEGIKATMKIVKTPAFQKLGARLPRIPLNACSHLKLNSDDYWRCYIEQTSSVGYHGCGTNKMGVKGEHHAVVDTKLRVYGVLGLRIADASVMPNLVNSNTQAAVYAIGEKASDMILHTWKTSPEAVAKEDKIRMESYKLHYIAKLIKPL